MQIDTIHNEDCLVGLSKLPDESVQCCVTSPPYYGLRDYGTATWEGGDAACDHKKVSDPVKAISTSTLGGGKKTTGHLQEGFGAHCGKCGAIRTDSQIGLEKSPEEYVSRMVQVFREVRRVLKSDGVLWLNLGDSYAGGAGGRGDAGRNFHTHNDGGATSYKHDGQRIQRKPSNGLKPKDLIGIPWMVAFALRADGWYLRQDIIWAKPNPMPESVRDRCTKAHEYLFLLSKSPRYFFDADAIREPTGTEMSANEYARRKAATTEAWYQRRTNPFGERKSGKPDGGVSHPLGRNKRSVWTVTPIPYKGAHFATMPEKLVEPCILAGSKEGDTILDPFMGAGTVAKVAQQLNRRYLGFELNAEYCALAQNRLGADLPQLSLLEQTA